MILRLADLGHETRYSSALQILVSQVGFNENCYPSLYLGAVSNLDLFSAICWAPWINHQPNSSKANHGNHMGVSENGVNA